MKNQHAAQQTDPVYGIAGGRNVYELPPTFHFGEGEHRTVAGGQRGNPCGVFLHDDELGWAEL